MVRSKKQFHRQGGLMRNLRPVFRLETEMNKNANILVKSNVWIDKARPQNELPYVAADHIPGDLMVEFLGTRDKRVLNTQMTPKQRDEYLAYRFFLFHGQTGLAYADRDICCFQSTNYPCQIGRASCRERV